MASHTPNSSRGLLIVVEGLDRSGKSSQCQILKDSLEQQGMKVRYVKFPDRTTPSGQMINSYLTGKSQQDDHSIHLLFSANRWEAIRSIREDIEKGINVIIDRYSFSGAVYSAAKGNPDLTLEWAWYPEIGLLQPDITIFLEISTEDAAKRGGYGDERYETEKMQARVRKSFQELFQRFSALNVHVIDAGQSIESVAAEIVSVFEEVSHKSDNIGPLLKLPNVFV